MFKYYFDSIYAHEYALHLALKNGFKVKVLCAEEGDSLHEYGDDTYLTDFTKVKEAIDSTGLVHVEMWKGYKYYGTYFIVLGNEPWESISDFSYIEGHGNDEENTYSEMNLYANEGWQQTCPDADVLEACDE